MKAYAVQPLPIEALRKYYRVNPLTGEVFSCRQHKRQRPMSELHKDTGYMKLTLRLGGKPFKARRGRVVYTMCKGEIPNDKEIDHINSDKTDDRLCNLRLVTRSRNSLNFNDKLDVRNRSGIRGVALVAKNKLWRARITVRGAIIQKYFKHKKDAIKCREAMETIYTLEVVHHEGR